MTAVTAASTLRDLHTRGRVPADFKLTDDAALTLAIAADRLRSANPAITNDQVAQFVDTLLREASRNADENPVDYAYSQLGVPVDGVTYKALVDASVEVHRGVEAHAGSAPAVDRDQVFADVPARAPVSFDDPRVADLLAAAGRLGLDEALRRLA